MNLQLNEWLKTHLNLSIMISFVFPKSLDMRLIVSQAQERDFRSRKGRAQALFLKAD